MYWKYFRYDTQHSFYFDAGTRNSIIYFILERTHFCENEEDCQENVGIEKLVSDGAYVCTYTLHNVSFRYFMSTTKKYLITGSILRILNVIYC